MSVFFVNYKEELKKLISEEYEPADTLSKEFEYTTFQLTELFNNVLPSNSIDEHTVYEALVELEFKPKEDPKLPLAYFWYFKRK
jgi:hypothetical protein